jgi:hypothetical protein
MTVPTPMRAGSRIAPMTKTLPSIAARATHEGVARPRAEPGLDVEPGGESEGRDPGEEHDEADRPIRGRRDDEVEGVEPEADEEHVGEGAEAGRDLRDPGDDDEDRADKDHHLAVGEGQVLRERVLEEPPGRQPQLRPVAERQRQPVEE